MIRAKQLVNELMGSSMEKAADDIATRKEEAARYSMFASGALAIMKLAAGLLTGSLALLSDALHALIDLGATIMTWIAVKISDKPADADHNYGHGKIEAVVALIETGLLLGLAAIVAITAVSNLSRGSEPLVQTTVAFIVLGISIAVDLVRWRSLTKVAEETGSHALAADALHFSSDLVSSVLVTAGLVAAVLGFRQGDAIAAIGVAAFIAVAGYRLGSRTIETLTDVAPRGVGDSIHGIVNAQRGVTDVERVRVRLVGTTLFVDLDIGVPRTLTTERINELKREIVEAIRREHPGAEVAIVTNARTLDSESVLEKILLIAANRRTPVHHVTVQEIEGRLSISLDIELDGRMALSAAHAIASKLETAIQDAFGPDTEVETHLEPLDAGELMGQEATDDIRHQIAGVIRLLLANVPQIDEAHAVRVRQTSRGLIVNLHVEAAAELTVEAVHQAVDELERRAKEACPDIHRIVTHAEPVKQS